MSDLIDTYFTPMRSYKSMSIRFIAAVCVPLLVTLVLRRFKVNGELCDHIGNVLLVVIIMFPASIRRIRPSRTIAPLNWHGGEIVIKARLLPKFFWTTASIDVYVNEICILKTGGQWTTRGTKEGEFWHDETHHVAQLSWTPPRNSFFYPFELKIDHVLVESGEVYIANALMSLVSVFLVIGIIWNVAMLVFHINR